MDAASSGHLPQIKTAVNDQTGLCPISNINSYVSMRTTNKDRTAIHLEVNFNIEAPM